MSLPTRRHLVWRPKYCERTIRPSWVCASWRVAAQLCAHRHLSNGLSRRGISVAQPFGIHLQIPMIHERNLMPNNRRTQTGARGSFHLIVAAVLAVATLACANGPATAVSPSGTGAASLDAKGGAVKAFTVAIS